MIPQLILVLAASVVITPGAVPIVADVHPDETAWIEEIKESRETARESLIVMTTTARSPFGVTRYPPESVDLILQAYFPTEEGLAWARRVGLCESSWRIDALGALGEVGWFQHRPEFWAERSRLAGWEGADIWDPQANTAVAAFMYYSPGYGPSHWTCK